METGEQMVECTVKYGEGTEYRERTEECTVEYRELTRQRREYMGSVRSRRRRQLSLSEPLPVIAARSVCA